MSFFIYLTPDASIYRIFVVVSNGKELLNFGRVMVLYIFQASSVTSDVTRSYSL